MITKQELELLNEHQYNLIERKDINKYVQVRIYKDSSKKSVISIFNKKNNSSILLYDTTFLSISKYINFLDSKKKIKNKRRKF